MAEAKKIEVEVESKATGDGLEETKRKIEDLGKSAGDGASAAVRGWKAWASASRTLQAAINGVKSTVAPLLFLADIVTNLVRKWNDWRESIRQAAEEARKMADEQARLERAGGMEKVAAAYRAIEESAKGAATEAQRRQSIEDAALKNARAMRDAQLDIAEQRELGAASTDAERGEISARYAAKRAAYSAGDAGSDSEREAGRLWKESEAKNAEAARIEGEVAAGAKEAYERLSKAQADLEGWYESLSSPGRMVQDRSLQGYHMVGARTPTEKETAEYEERKKALEAEAAAAEKAFGEMADAAAALRAEAGYLDEMSAAKRDEAAAEALAGEAAAMRLGREEAAAKARVDDERARRAADEETLRTAPGEIDAIVERINGQIAIKNAAIDRKNSEDADVYLAKERLLRYRLSGGTGYGGREGSRREWREANDDLARQTAEAEAAGRELMETAARTGETVKALEARMKELERRLSAAQSRQNAAYGLGAAQVD